MNTIINYCFVFHIVFHSSCGVINIKKCDKKVSTISI